MLVEGARRDLAVQLQRESEAAALVATAEQQVRREIALVKASGADPTGAALLAWLPVGQQNIVRARGAAQQVAAATLDARSALNQAYASERAAASLAEQRLAAQMLERERKAQSTLDEIGGAATRHRMARATSHG